MMTGVIELDPKAGRRRWVVCGLLFAATAVNYIDRQMIGVLKPTLKEELGWQESDFATIVFWFQMAYAIGYISFGRIVDVLGARLGYAVAIVIWTAGHMAHGFATGVASFAAARFGLGVGESGNFPAGIKAVADWFPQRERAFAIGLFNAGANVGAIITPLLVPALVLWFGWRSAFFITGIFGLAWLVAWWALYRHPREEAKITPGELAWIEQDPADTTEKIGWSRLITLRETWAYALAKFLIDPIWWFFLFWLPGYLFDRYHLDLKSFGLPLAAIYIISDLGSVAGGWLSSFMLKRGYSVNAARKLAMLICAFCVLPIYFAQSIESVWGAVLVIGLATAAHQAFSANVYTLPSDMFPRAAVGSVVGIGGTIGALGGMGMALFTGYILDATHSYELLFAICASAYLVALAVVHLLSPRLAPATVE
ncbi:MAG: hexuronate transporter [Novosphingobium sp. SCN 63-17]|uniref:MFS transporter n=2 Tax=unclassified Novosphingobium TaxID=2644732 RepID=UPI00086C0244|nr:MULTISPECIES: MFS transporter [unclassified Novosphingobium]MBN9143915.1 MFS transporter [Novosphingobium sp.]ODU84494.1 MAG: hexuronate transporter [Novosphingobium sp. SCN 63-17]OJX93032.1 MAG: MFS transporter [Novosphingobium sp. 63-713]